MARPNYSSLKRTKELKRKAKREAKLARKHARKVTGDQGDPAAGSIPEDPSPVSAPGTDPSQGTPG